MIWFRNVVLFLEIRASNLVQKRCSVSGKFRAERKPTEFYSSAKTQINIYGSTNCWLGDYPNDLVNVMNKECTPND